MAGPPPPEVRGKPLSRPLRYLLGLVCTVGTVGIEALVFYLIELLRVAK